ncbi:signal transduction histidine kinase [Collimonas sp. PA-H2]|uniref:sensor histidine kinase n=1 Tax=Collimonas sp. PA-H2 TaxID=1881062 RepID=UPI000C0074B4|nr:HAMP domain-containing sensor histidine kinase [Collimonas sp. PA-H2]PFH12360.1 signal transduction histidine kinase [Collimonas sp. PA-H2]
MPYSLAKKLIASTAATLVIITVAATAFLAATYQWEPELLFRQEMFRNADKIADSMRFDASGSLSAVALSPKMQLLYEALKLDSIYRILDDQGIVLLASDGVMIPLFAAGTRFDPKSAVATDLVLSRSGLRLHVFTKAVSRKKKTFYIQVARSERMHQAIIGSDSASFMAASGIAAIIAILVFTIVVWFTFNRALRPLRVASDAASLLESNSLDFRLPTADMPAELVPLIDAFNKALGRLELGYRLQQEFLATVAHELKTPLALIRGQIELDGAADRKLLLKDVDFMARQVHQLLHLAEVSDRKNFVFEQVDVVEVARSAVEHLGRLADRLSVFILCNAPPEKVVTMADSGALFVLVKNLLENALHHSPVGTGVLITITSDYISIRDHGRGIAPDNLPRLFKRFWRGENRRDEGAGLGLSICKEISFAHDWNLIVNHDKDPGAEFVVAFR